MSRPRMLFSRAFSSSLRRPAGAESRFNRPAPAPLPPAQQREFEELVRRANEGAPPADSTSANSSDGAKDTHPDARAPVQAEFVGDVNPATGEQGGPKREPVRKWAPDGGDWSFKGRVTDF